MRAGNAEVKKHMRLLHGSLLPELESLIAHQTLELQCMRSGSGGSSEGLFSWMFGSKDEEQWWTARNSLGQTGSIPVPYVAKVNQPHHCHHCGQTDIYGDIQIQIPILQRFKDIQADRAL